MFSFVGLLVLMTCRQLIVHIPRAGNIGGSGLNGLLFRVRLDLAFQGHLAVFGDNGYVVCFRGEGLILDLRRDECCA